MNKLLHLAFALTAFLSLAAHPAQAADEASASVFLRLAVTVSPETRIPEIVFVAENKGTSDVPIKEVFTIGSEVSWTGPRGIQWQGVTSAGSGLPPKLVRMNSELVMLRMSIKELYLMIDAQASQGGTPLQNGDLFHVTWTANGVQSNEVLLRFEKPKE